MKKTVLGILFGGRSGEHEVSLSSAANVIQAVDRSRFDVRTIGLTRDGEWLVYAGPAEKIRDGSWIGDSANITPLISDPGGVFGDTDVFFPVLHGTFGEDGTVQGLFEMAGKPYVGCGVLASAAAMDKDTAKRLLRAAGLECAVDVCVRSGEFAAKGASSLASELARTLGLPVFVKPANLGSSVGISKAHDESELALAIEKAFAFDSKILCEEFIEGRELEVAVLGNSEPEAAWPGEIVPCNEFYDYDAKYLSGDDSLALIPAPVSRETAARVREMAVTAYRALGCEGLSRVDFFLTPQGKLVINEINTMPGFTDISMYPKLWENEGLGCTDLITRLVELALERFKAREALSFKRSLNE